MRGRAARALARRGLGLLGALSAGACSEPAAPPAPLSLAALYEPPSPVALAGALSRVAGEEVEAREGPDAAWFWAPLPAGSWQEEEPGVRSARFPFAPGARTRLVLDGHEVPRVVAAGERAGRVTYDLARDRVLVHGLDAAPAEAELGTTFAVERDAGGRLALGDYSGLGIPLGPDRPARLRVDLPPASALRFFPVALNHDYAGGTGRATFRVLLDGAELLAVEQDARREARGAWRTVPLPPEGRSGAALELRLEGEACSGVILAPTVGPLAPAAPARPDVVLFLADTFRADGLTVLGGHGQAPNLDRLAEESVCFLRARAPASWTLPSQASLLSGLYPIEHGTVQIGDAIPPACVTLAERLSAAGYRTGAVTDSACVGNPFGFGQGMEWFEEHKRRDLGLTLSSARAFLDATDGRPSFLFVQTYRTHHPYRTGTDEDVSEWQRLMQEHWGGVPIMRVWNAGDGDAPVVDFKDPVPLRDLRELYDKGVSALDQELGAWVAGLEERGFFERGYLLFTSDHGEAFGLHGQLLHSGPLWEELIRVPLLLRGPGLAPREVADAVSLVDVPTTLARLAGVPPDASWRGTDLLSEQRDLPVLGFGGRTLVAVEGNRKVFAEADPEGLRAGRFDAAFDLARDPDEQGGLHGRDAPWAAERARALADVVRAWSARRLQGTAAELSGDDLRALEALGYGGGK